MSFADWLGNLGPILWLRIKFGAGKPRVDADIGSYTPPDAEIVDRMRRAEGKQEER